jgi:adenylosuccinate lyase
MAVQFTDSAIYRNSWGTEDLRAVFDEEPRTRGWLEVMAILAETQAEFGLIPASEARHLAATCRETPLDAAFFEEAREGFEATNHSLLGIVRALQRRCPGESGEWLCYGVTVQDVTDCWWAQALVRTHTILARDLAAVEGNLLRLARSHRDTVMCGRTHGQPGLPVTFGFKAAQWTEEVRRHRDRLDSLKVRMGVGQLGGGVGSLSSLGSRALELQQRFIERLGLKAPLISWTSARDTLAEWGYVLALVSGTADKIGHEVYNLQRPEIGELREGSAEGTVGSITMPHKRNPEISEHLGTLARVVRHQAALLGEGVVHDHERDGRSWKAEWAVLPAMCLAAGKLLSLLDSLTANLEVDAARMEANLRATRGFIFSEAVMLALAVKTGKQTAHRVVHETAMKAVNSGTPFKDAVLAEPAIARYLSAEEIARLFDFSTHAKHCAAMADRVIEALESRK